MRIGLETAMTIFLLSKSCIFNECIFFRNKKQGVTLTTFITTDWEIANSVDKPSHKKTLIGDVQD